MSSNIHYETIENQILIWVETFFQFKFTEEIRKSILNNVTSSSNDLSDQYVEQIYSSLPANCTNLSVLVNHKEKLYTDKKSEILAQVSKLFQAINELINCNEINEKKKALSQTIEKILEEIIKLLEKIKQSGSFLFGEFISIEDFILYELLRIMILIDENIVHINYKKLQKNKRIFSYMDKFENKTNLFHNFYSIETLEKFYGKNLINNIHDIDKIITEKKQTFIDFAILNNVIFVYKKNNEPYLDQAPFTGYPMKLNKDSFMELYKKQTDWLKIINNLARDDELIQFVFSQLSKQDEFVKNLYEIYLKDLKYKFRQEYFFTIGRNDYMFHQKKQLWKQIEFNNIAVAGFNMCERTQKHHNQLLEEVYDDLDQYEHLDNNNNRVLAQGFKEAYQHYNNKNAYIVFIASKLETFLFDQRMLEKEMTKLKIPTFRVVFEELHSKMKVDEESGKLFIEGKEIAIAYYRHGYRPEHYPTEKEWKVREQIELSNAIKVPTVSSQLINFKKIQEILAIKPHLFQKYLGSEEESKLIKDDSAKFWAIESQDDIEKLTKKVKKNPKGYVLKPQREGGGNNIFGEEMVKAFETYNENDLKAFTLMELVKPIPRIGYLIKNQSMEKTLLLSEVGFYGYVTSNKDKIIKSQSAGYLVRSKKSSSNEVNVCSGFGGFDSIIFNKNL